MLQTLAKQQGIHFVELMTSVIEDKVLKAVPGKFVWHYKIMPVSLEGNFLTVALADPFNMWPIDDLETHLGFKVGKVLAASADIEAAIRNITGWARKPSTVFYPTKCVLPRDGAFCR